MKGLFAVLLLAAAAVPASAQRLPENVRPSHYEIRIEPDLSNAKFSGSETITVMLQSPATTFVLNAAEIEFGTVEITAGRSAQTAKVTLDAAKQQATFTIPESIPAGEARIKIDYTGTLNDDLRGLYLSKANNRRYAVTQFEATDARRMFPSFDEPAFKATFSLTAVIDANDHAISNGAVISDSPGPRDGQHTIAFETTPRMSSYLVALAVGDFVCNEGKADGIPIRICSTPDKKGLTDFALESTEEIVRYYNRYYSITYPFKKLDVVAVPDFAAGAMENTGAIFYRETLLLADKNASVEARQNIATVLAHEIAHQWFGDLVTMQWWDDIWLNEGFATWMQTKPIKAWKPEWQLEVNESDSNQTAMRLDALESTRPIRARAETPAQINELFDPIAYEKGGAVLRMIESWVGEEEFRKGINEYINRFKYGNARAEDFWSTIAASTSKPVDRVMATFVDQPGVPLLNVSTSCRSGTETVTVTQSRYETDSTRHTSTTPSWIIPVCLRHPSGPATCELVDASKKTIPLKSCSGWIMPNWGGRGYYRASLDKPALKALESNVTRLSASERLTLLSDEWALVKARAQDVVGYLDLAASFAFENVEQVVSELSASLRHIDDSFTTSTTRPVFRSWIRKTFGPSAERVGWDPENGRADDNVRAVRAAFLTMLGDADDPNTIAAARRLVNQELTTPKSVDATLLAAAVRVAAAHGDVALYERYVARIRAAVEPGDRDLFLRALGSFRDPAVTRRTFDLALGPDVRSQDTSLAIAAQLANDAARDLTWDLIRERWTDVEKKSSSFGGNTVIVGALGSFCDAGRAQEIKTFFAAHPVPDAERTLAQTIETINTCAALSSPQTSKLAAWLDARRK